MPARFLSRPIRAPGKRRITVYTGGGLRPRTKNTMNRMTNKTKSTCAIHAAVPAMPEKPSSAARTAMTRKTIDQVSNADLHAAAPNPFITPCVREADPSSTPPAIRP